MLTLHYLFTLSYRTYTTESYLELRKRVESLSFSVSIYFKMLNYINCTKFINNCKMI